MAIYLKNNHFPTLIILMRDLVSPNLLSVKLFKY